MKKHIVFGTLIFIFSFWSIVSLGHAANWDYVCSGKDSTSYYLDVSSVDKQGDLLRFWRKGVHQEVQNGEKEFQSYHEVHLAKPLESRMLEIISYDESGNVIRDYNNPTEWRELRKGSIVYAIANAAMHYVQ